MRYLSKVKTSKLKLIFLRVGKRNMPFYKLVVVSGQNNKYVDFLGFYKILLLKQNNFHYKIFGLNKIKLLKYLSNGLVPSIYVFRFLKKLQIF
jgi:ribosomal protein S16